MTSPVCTFRNCYYQSSQNSTSQILLWVVLLFNLLFMLFVLGWIVEILGTPIALLVRLLENISMANLPSLRCLCWFVIVNWIPLPKSLKYYLPIIYCILLELVRSSKKIQWSTNSQKVFKKKKYKITLKNVHQFQYLYCIHYTVIYISIIKQWCKQYINARIKKLVFHFQVLYSTVVSPPPYSHLLGFKWCAKSSCSMELFIFFMEKRQEALKKETFWLDIRGNIFMMTSQAVEQAAQKVVHSLSLKILKTRLDKTLSNLVWPYSSPRLRQSNRTRNLSSFLPFWIILWSDEIIISQIKQIPALSI